MIDMHKWNKVDPHNLDYIEKQVKAIKDKHPSLNDEESNEVETRKIEDILEEQLNLLQQIQHTLEKVEVSVTKKGWKNLF